MILRSLLLVCGMLLSGCSTFTYYLQSVGGHLQLVGHSRPVTSVLQDRDLSSRLRRQLELSQQIRDFASRQLALPDNGSYRSYAQLNRKAVLWSVVATPRFSVEPRQWCYPVIGCASYRGYFSRESADGFGADLRREGLDVAVEPVPAYSTLGWFDDPLPSTVIGWPEGDLAGLIFHELAHQRLYLPDDSAFNEAFATAVQRIGTERWFQARNDRAGLRQWRQAQRRERQFVHLILQTRKRLQALYARTLTTEEMARKKAAAFRQLQREYVAMRKGWGAAPAFDGWMGRNLNNAHLALIATYEEWEPAFRELLARAGGDLPEFYRQAEALARLSPEQRLRMLRELRVAARQRGSVK